jgi:hypothetical protein
MPIDLTAPSVDDVVAEARRRIRTRRQALIDSGLEDQGTRNLIRVLGSIRIGAHSHRQVRAALTVTAPTTDTYSILSHALDVDMAALGFPADVVNRTDIVQIDESTAALRF